MKTVFGHAFNFIEEQGTAVSLGNFDGVHLGHRKLLGDLTRLARKQKLCSVVYTFCEHPLSILRPNEKLQFLCDRNTKISLLEETGVDAACFADFSEVCSLSPRDFVKEILVDKLNIRQAVIGENNRFGKHSAGDAKMLMELGREFGFSVHVTKPYTVDGTVCSSSKIRERILSGDCRGAAKLLGRPYTIQGVVTEGKHLGRTYGFPTANLIPQNEIALPKYGVYATNAWIDGSKYVAVTNVGETSFDRAKIVRIESNLFDFNQDIYGKQLKLEFLYRMRDFIPFESVNQLKNQLEQDKENRLKAEEVQE